MSSRHRQTVSWTSLPNEIRLIVLGAISHDKSSGWTSLAAVCKEWQDVIEKENFRRLTIQQTDLEEFQRVVVRQRPPVRHICLDIRLPRYCCTSCRNFPYQAYRRYPYLIPENIAKLFSILQNWQPTGLLKLELTASSTSDSEHWFKNYYHGPSKIHKDIDDWIRNCQTGWHDPGHGWSHGSQVKIPSKNAILRLFTWLCRDFHENIPEVHAVTEFAIHRQVRRHFPSTVLQVLMDRLPRLESLVCEVWRVPAGLHRAQKIMDLASTLERSSLNHVKRISIFEDFNDLLQSAFDYRDPTAFPDFEDSSMITTCTLKVIRQLTDALALNHDNLECLSVSYIIDAQQLFSSCHKQSRTWHRLQSLTLTSAILGQENHPKDIEALLRNASECARHMPTLACMSLWYGTKEQAAAFIFQRDESRTRATLTWRGTWRYRIGDDVVEAWKEVATDTCQFQVKYEDLQGVDIISHGDAIHHLRLPDGVIAPESLRQIREEGRIPRKA